MQVIYKAIHWIDLLGQQLRQVVILLRGARGASALSPAARPLALLGARPALLPPVDRRHRRGRDEEVDAPALELGVGRHDDELLGGAPDAGGGPRRGDGVVGVRGEDGAARDRAAELVDAAAEVDDADDVEGAAGEHAGQAAPQAVAHVVVAGAGVGVDGDEIDRSLAWLV